MGTFSKNAMLYSQPLHFLLETTSFNSVQKTLTSAVQVKGTACM